MFTQSPHASDCSNRNQLGDLRGNADLKTAAVGSNYSPSCGDSVMWGFGFVGLLLVMCAETKEISRWFPLHTRRRKALISLRLGSSVGTGALCGEYIYLCVI